MTTLDIDVIAYTGPTFADGLAFKYSLSDPKAVTSAHLDDPNGNIWVPAKAVPIDIVFHLKTATVTWPKSSDSYNLSFALGNGTNGSDTLNIRDSSGNVAASKTFSPPQLDGNMVVKTTIKTSDKKGYDYCLTVGATLSSDPNKPPKIHKISVDPRIRNGGDTLNNAFGPYVLAVIAGIVLATAAYVAWRFLAPSTP